MKGVIYFIGIVLIFVGYKTHKFLQPGPVPKLDETWWGNGDPSKQDTSIRPFKINVPDEVLDDLRYRLNHTRPLVPPLEGIQHQYGLNTNLLQDVLRHWLNDYKWRSREQYLNRHPQFLTNVQGLDIHYIHAKPAGSTPPHVVTLPLLLLHGWPGSVREFSELIPLLTTVRSADQKYVFEVFAPSLPGYAFSQAAVRPGLGAAQMALVFRNFMRRMGHERFYAQAGDFGAIIFHAMTVLYPENVLGFHSNFCFVRTPLSILKTFVGVVYPRLVVKDEHYDRVYPIAEKFYEYMRESGYMHLQATKPDTIGVGMRDSPAALAAYILEKFVTGTDFTKRAVEDGGLKDWYTYDDLLDNIMLYWVTGSMPTAFRLYAETFGLKHRALGVLDLPMKRPTACARFKNDFFGTDAAIYELNPNLVHLHDFDEGHFAAFQVPKVLAKDLFEAVEKFEAINAKEQLVN